MADPEPKPNVRIEGTTILGEVVIAAPRERVFRALSDPERLRSWWGSKESYWVESWESDLRVGGSWRCRCRNVGGGESFVHGVFLVVDPPARLVYTWNPSWGEPGETRVAYDLYEQGSGTTLVRVAHAGFEEGTSSLHDHANGWPAVLGWLRLHVERSDERAELSR